MYYYKMFGLNVESDRKLEHALETVEIDHVHVQIKKDNIQSIFTNYPSTEDFGNIFWESKTSIKLSFNKYANFLLQNGESIKYQIINENEQDYIDRLILTVVFMILLKQRNVLVVHGSTLNIKGKALLISGDSGAGKSTLTSELLNKGYHYLCDDMSPLTLLEKNVYVDASYPRRKLDYNTLVAYDKNPSNYELIKNEFKEKYVVIDEDNYYSSRLNIYGIIIIMPCEEEEVTLQSIEGVNKIKYLQDSLYIKTLNFNLPMDTIEISNLIEIASLTKIYVLKRPRNSMTVKKQVELIEESIVNLIL